MMLECRKNDKIGWGDAKNTKGWNLTVRALLIRKIQFEEEKSKIRCLWTQLNFIQGLIEFMEGLIARKLIS
jgi:hypothetical protein